MFHFSSRRSASSLLLLLALTLPLPAAAKRPLTPEDLWAMERVGEPSVSPDGRWVVFTLTRYSVAENKGDSDLWLVPADGSAPPRRITWNPGSDGSPVWSPDGKRLAFVSKRGDGEPQLYILPVEGGEAEPVTKLPVGVQSPKWFPDGKRLGFLAATWPDVNDDWTAVEKRAKELKDDKTQAKIADSRILRIWDQYRTDGRFFHVFAVDLDSRKVSDLTPGLDRWMDLMSPDGSWDLAPDGKEIVVSVNSTDAPYKTLNYDLWSWVVGDGGDGKPAAPRNLTAANPADDIAPVYSPDGRFIAFGRNHRPEVDPDFSHLALLDRKTGEVRELAPDWDNFATGWAFTPDSRTLVFHAADRGRVHLYSLPVEGGTPLLLIRGGVTGGVDAGRSGNGTRLVFQRQSITSPTELFAVDLPGVEPKALTSFNTARMAEIDLPEVEDATFEGANGDPVHMLLVFPPGFDRSRKWPLVQLIHGGPFGAFQNDFGYRWNAAVWAARGYVVAMVNFHGSTGYGQAFAESILGNHAELPFTDVMKATDWLIAHGYIDDKRMAAAGGSYGGYLTDWILGHTDRFAALITHAGVYDLMAQFASDLTFGRPANYGAAPWTDPAQVDRFSPSHFAPNFKTPTLITHGEKDYRVPVSQGINLYGVLQGKGIPTRIVLFPDENHWITKPQASLLWWKETLGWLDRWIGDGRATAPAKAK